MSIYRSINNVNNILSILANSHTREILIYLMNKPRSVQEISEKFNIPRSTVYRKMKELESLDLVKIASSIINTKGRRSYVYKSKINSISITLDKEGLNIKLE